MLRGGLGGWVDRPELSERVMDQCDRGSLGGSDVPALAQKVDLVVGVDPSFQVESQMEVQQGCRRTGTGDRALFGHGFLPGSLGAEVGRATAGGILTLNLSVSMWVYFFRGRLPLVDGGIVLPEFINA